MQVNNEAGEQKNKALDKLLWVLVIVTIAVMVWGNDYFADNPIIRIIGVAALSVLALVLCALTNKGKAVIAFAKESKIEMKKVVWPTRKETINTTLMVGVLTLVVGLFLWGIDSFFMFIIGLLTGARF